MKFFVICLNFYLFLIIETQLKQVICLYSTKVAYINSFTPSQLEFINQTENYQLEKCV